jgi:hypothetical protein
MNSLENFGLTPASQLPEEIKLPKAEAYTTAWEKQDQGSEQIAETKVEKPDMVEKANEAIITMRTATEKGFKEKGFSFEKIVGKGVLGFAVASMLMSSPQFTEAAMATNATESMQSNQSLPNKADEIISQWNKEDNQLSQESLAHRKDMNNYEYNYYDIANEIDVACSIDVLPEGGLSIGFSGDINDVTEIPSAFMDKLSEIKEHPVQFIYLQLLNMAAGGSVERQVDIETVGQDDFENFGKTHF